MDVNVTDLRRKLAAPNRPDEGMRGTVADKVRQEVAHHLETLDHLSEMLTRGSDQEIEDSAAAIRSCLMGPSEGTVIGAVLAAPLCKALQRADSFESRCWVLFAMVRLAQFKDCQNKLLDAGVLQILMAAWQKGPEDSGVQLGHYGGSPCGIMRLDIVTCHILAFLSETGGSSVASQVPLSAIESFVQALETRVSIAREFSEPDKDTECTEAEKLVKIRGFYGCPLYYRPRFVLQALHSVAVASEEHARAMWSTPLPLIVSRILEGSCPNDSIDNKPYGSPDAIDVCKLLSNVLMSHSDSVEAQTRNTLARAMEAVSLYA